MKAEEIMEALRKRWPESENVHVAEAPMDSGRQGRKIDLLVISMWHSRGHERDAVEIKVSMADFRKELKEPEKADFWWKHAHRFWVAVPADLADKVKAELPTSWGLLAVSDEGVARIKVKAPVNRDAKPLPEKTVVGVIRAAENAGPSALARAHSEGRSEGYREGQARAEANLSTGPRNRYQDEFNEQVRIFTELTGATPNDLHQAWGAKYASAVKLLTSWGSAPAQQLANMDRAIEAVRRSHQDLAPLRDEVAKLFDL